MDYDQLDLPTDPKLSPSKGAQLTGPDTNEMEQFLIEIREK